MADEVPKPPEWAQRGFWVAPLLSWEGKYMQEEGLGWEQTREEEDENGDALGLVT